MFVTSLHSSDNAEMLHIGMPERVESPPKGQEISKFQALKHLLPSAIFFASPIFIKPRAVA